jgi:hypothetical protein
VAPGAIPPLPSTACCGWMAPSQSIFGNAMNEKRTAQHMRAIQRALPDDKMLIDARGEDEEDRAAAA